MALLFVDSFDHYAVTPPRKYWSGVFGTSTGGRFGSRRGGIAASDEIRTIAAASGATIVTGCALRPTPSPGGLVGNYDPILFFSDAGTDQIALVASDAGALMVTRGTSKVPIVILARSAPGVVRAGQFRYVEMKVVISNVGGTVEVRVNGKTVILANSLDTQASANAAWQSLHYGTTGESWAIDDIYVCDGTGPAPYNAFLGDTRVEVLMPQTDAVAAGSNAGLTPSTGTDHGALVDEAPTENDDTDYNAGATAGVKDTYNYPSMASTGTILAVQPVSFARKADVAPKQIKNVLRHSGVDYDGATAWPLGVYWTYFPEIYVQNPGTSAAWTTSDVNAVQAGIKVTT